MLLLYALLAVWVGAMALLILVTPYMLYAVLGYLGLLMGMAAIYFLQGAAFIAVVSAIVGGSGVVVLLLFSTLFVPVGTRMPPKSSLYMLVALIVGIWWGGQWPIVRFATRILQQKESVCFLHSDAVSGLGLQLLGPYVLVFEWIGITLLIALVGVVGLMKE
mmetsp:Transcript_10945/g.25426  ORF Transcript_10945/g.25426 Transcript_10945/m.25426 type:complete len:162 (+) Transcript_10945:6397-6882(+)